MVIRKLDMTGICCFKIRHVKQYGNKKNRHAKYMIFIKLGMIPNMVKFVMFGSGTLTREVKLKTF